MNAMQCKACRCEGNGMRCEVCGGIVCPALDRIVKACTAFNTLAEMLCTMRESGYVPTVYGDTKAKRKLIAVIKSHGLKVWGNKGKNW